MSTVSILNTTSGVSGKTVVIAESPATITGLLSFSRGVSAPFAVASGAAKVDNLDADKLDGFEGSAFLQLAGGTMLGDLKFTDASYDIGKAGATRPRHYYGSGDITIGGWLQHAGQARVSTQFDKTTDTALANVTGLSLTLEAGKTYAFSVVLFCSCTTNGGVKVALSGTATVTALRAQGILIASDAIVTSTRVTALNSNIAANTALTNAYLLINGTITVNAAGTFTVQFAQNASHSDTSSVLTGSTLIATRIA